MACVQHMVQCSESSGITCPVQAFNFVYNKTDLLQARHGVCHGYY